ncbi:hypothetical protein TNCV_3758931 [Trichonephila clavipes]|nr:hypothetical protein TNCV_3758931 [Trichonephila clavipes]
MPFMRKRNARYELKMFEFNPISYHSSADQIVPKQGKRKQLRTSSRLESVEDEHASLPDQLASFMVHCPQPAKDGSRSRFD